VVCWLPGPAVEKSSSHEAASLFRGLKSCVEDCFRREDETDQRTLKAEEVSMEPGDIATWAAALIAVVSAVLTIWIPLRRRPEAGWAVLSLNSDPERAYPGLERFRKGLKLGTPDLCLMLLNDGDGDAYDVVVDGIGCNVEMLDVERYSEGHNEFSKLSLYPRIGMTDSRLLLAYRDEKSESDFIGIRIHWLLSPTRLQKKVFQQLSLEGEMPPMPKYPIPEPSKEKTVGLLRYRFQERSRQRKRKQSQSQHVALRHDAPKGKQ
jgi:hypothetical protein